MPATSFLDHGECWTREWQRRSWQQQWKARRRWATSRSTAAKNSIQRSPSATTARRGILHKSYAWSTTTGVLPPSPYSIERDAVFHTEGGLTWDFPPQTFVLPSHPNSIRSILVVQKLVLHETLWHDENLYCKQLYYESITLWCFNQMPLLLLISRVMYSGNSLSSCMQTNNWAWVMSLWCHLLCGTEHWACANCTSSCLYMCIGCTSPTSASWQHSACQ